MVIPSARVKILEKLPNKNPLCDIHYLLQIPTKAKKNLHSRRQENAHIRVQNADAPAEARDAPALVSGGRH